MSELWTASGAFVSKGMEANGNEVGTWMCKKLSYRTLWKSNRDGDVLRMLTWMCACVAYGLLEKNLECFFRLTLCISLSSICEEYVVECNVEMNLSSLLTKAIPHASITNTF